MALVPTELDKPVVYESGWYYTDVVYVCTLIYIYYIHIFIQHANVCDALAYVHKEQTICVYIYGIYTHFNLKTHLYMFMIHLHNIALLDIQNL